MNIEYKIYGTLAVGVVASLMIAARRYKNTKEVGAGAGIAGWAIFTIFCIWV